MGLFPRTGTITAHRQPRGGKPEKSGEVEKRGARQGAARSPLTVFRRAWKLAYARVLDTPRSMWPFAVRIARAATSKGFAEGVQEERREQASPFRLFARAVMADITKPKPRSTPIPSPQRGIDPTASGRAAAAAATVYARYEGLIEAIRHDPSLTPDQRAERIASLRRRAKAEAEAESKLIMDAAKGAANRRRLIEKGRG